MTTEKRSAAVELLRRSGATVASVARALGVWRGSIYRYLEQEPAPLGTVG